MAEQSDEYHGPAKDKYRHALITMFRVIQQEMDLNGSHPEEVGAISFEELPDGKINCVMAVDLKPGKSTQSFAEWFLTPLGDITRVGRVH